MPIYYEGGKQHIRKQSQHLLWLLCYLAGDYIAQRFCAGRNLTKE